jgi:hypothetical protein
MGNFRVFVSNEKFMIEFNLVGICVLVYKMSTKLVFISALFWCL